MTLSDLRASYVAACRKPQHLEVWATDWMPKFFELLQAIEDADAQGNCPGSILVYSRMCYPTPQKPKERNPDRYDGKL